MTGIYNNETSKYEEVPWLTDGLWLEQDSESELFDENGPYMWIIPNEGVPYEEGTAEIEGPDHVKFVQGEHANRHVLDILNSICHKMKPLDPRTWLTADEWARFGLIPVSDCLKRFSEQDGPYHA